ncbi:MAG: Uma2 family endonuclease [Moorea sp. SIO2B7]|nr:Uma2 family endonuclease [Moorena sp. SIO2B7]
MTKTLTKPIAENFIFLKNITWETFNNLLDELGDNRGQRLTYYLGTLQIMSPLGEHENDNRFIDDIIRAMADELNLNLKKFGSLTLKLDPIKQAVEPDSCYYIKNEPLVRHKQNIDLTIDPPPDLVLEIDITSGSLNKLPIYANLQVPELWLFDGKKVTVFTFHKDSKSYLKNNQSPTFPWLDLTIIPQLISKSLQLGETATLKQFRQWVRDYD